MVDRALLAGYPRYVVSYTRFWGHKSLAFPLFVMWFLFFVIFFSQTGNYVPSIDTFVLMFCVFTHILYIIIQIAKTCCLLTHKWQTITQMSLLFHQRWFCCLTRLEMVQYHRKNLKEVTWFKLCLCTNGHRSAALWRLPFILPPVFVQAAVIRSWYELIRPVCSLMRSINSFRNRLKLHHKIIYQEVINTETWPTFQFLWIFSWEIRYSFFYQYVPNQ